VSIENPPAFGRVLRPDAKDFLNPAAYMKLHSKFVWERFPTAIKIDRIPLFDVSRHRHRHGYGVIERSIFDIHYSIFAF